jgi:hypothetical protein
VAPSGWSTSSFAIAVALAGASFPACTRLDASDSYPADFKRLVCLQVRSVTMRSWLAAGAHCYDKPKENYAIVARSGLPWQAFQGMSVPEAGYPH